MTVTTYQDLPLADRDRNWDGDAAETRVRRWAAAEDGPTNSEDMDLVLSTGGADGDARCACGGFWVGLEQPVRTAAARTAES